jgi:predicted negative regulator of RcsB-dependent stress response
MRPIVCLIALCILSGTVRAAQYALYNANCSKAYTACMCLHLNQADSLLATEDPNNIFATYIADYKDCLQLLFNANEIEFNALKPNLQKRISFLQNTTLNNEYIGLCKAGIYWHWALVYFRMGETVKAANYFRKAHAQFKENEKRYPDFDYNKVFSGISEILIGSLPDNYKWIASAMGFKGSIDKGCKMLHSFLAQHKPGDLLYAECNIYYTYALFYFNQNKEAALQQINDHNFAPPDNYLNLFVKSNVCLNYRKAADGLTTLQTITSEAVFKQYPAFYLEMGSAYYYKSDTVCRYYFQQFLRYSKGKTFIKDCWMMLAQSYYLQGLKKEANYCKENISKQGSQYTDADKHAQYAASKNNWPNAAILQAHILTDGGYYTQALAILQKLTEADFSSLQDKAEYWLRLGRVYEELNENDKALNCYFICMAKAKYLPDYFAARAALQSGFIYEKLHKNPEAIKAYRNALNMPAHDFQASIDQLAKAGINRLSN